MVANITFNPLITTNGLGSFNVQSDGFVQGQAMDDPSARYRLRGGVLSSAATLPMWGGVGISETTNPITNGSPSGVMGGNITRATQIAGTAPAAGDLTGFSVFDQDYAMVNTPQSPVPLAGSGQSVHLYPFGSRARIALAIDPSLVTLEGNVISQQVSWDFVNQRLVPYAPYHAAVTITGATWASTGGGQATYTVGVDLTTFLTAGNDITVTGVVSTGATTDGYNGSWTVVSVTATTVVVSLPRASSPGTYSSGGTIAAFGGAVPCTILNVNIGNSMVVSYDTTTGFATWNRSGSCALVQI